MGVVPQSQPLPISRHRHRFALGHAPGSVASRSQSAALITTLAPNRSQNPSATDVVAVRMADHDIFDRLRIKPSLVSPFANALQLIVEERVNDDDAVRGHHGPSGVLRLTEKIKVVEDFDWRAYHCARGGEGWAAARGRSCHWQSGGGHTAT
jgi:hypothetical protein